ncbi:MAG TPA: hypothetical protein VNW46_15840 [Gemmatimonadaceae bacterium]|nr:hypothetical protein [Gemmatimonadaceae bacterium]
MTTHPSDTPASPDCEAFDAMLADYLERTLDAEWVAMADTHRASCARCDALVRDLEALQAQAEHLAPLTPSRDLWPGIAARIGTPVSSLDHRRTRSRPWIATRAAAALLLLTAGTTYAVARLSSRPTGPTQHVAESTPPLASTPLPTVATPTPQPTVTPVSHKQSAEATYAQEIAGLHAIVEQRNAQLDPHTRAVIEHNLQVIDTAIAESRRALANDPHSAFLGDQLDQALSTKLELLRTVALLPART